MQFDEKNFCPYIIDKSTPLKKFLYCTKKNDLCKMVTYFPSGKMIPKMNVLKDGCQYGYAIQDIKEDKVTEKKNVLDDISVKKKNVSSKNKKKNINQNVKNTTKKKSTKKNTKKKEA